MKLLSWPCLVKLYDKKIIKCRTIAHAKRVVPDGNDNGIFDNFPEGELVGVCLTGTCDGDSVGLTIDMNGIMDGTNDGCDDNSNTTGTNDGDVGEVLTMGLNVCCSGKADGFPVTWAIGTIVG